MNYPIDDSEQQKGTGARGSFKPRTQSYTEAYGKPVIDDLSQEQSIEDKLAGVQQMLGHSGQRPMPKKNKKIKKTKKKK